MATNQEMVQIVDRALTVPKQGTRITHCPTNLDLTTTKGKAMMLKAAGPGDYEIKAGEPIRLVVTHWVLLPDTREDEETGEISEFVRTIFFDADGFTFRTSAAHSPLRLCAMLELFNAAEWAAGIPLIISVKTGKRGRLYHDIQVDTEARFSV